MITINLSVNAYVNAHALQLIMEKISEIPLQISSCEVWVDGEKVVGNSENEKDEVDE